MDRNKLIPVSLTIKATYQVFFTIRKVFYMIPSIKNKNNRVCSSWKCRKLKQVVCWLSVLSLPPHVMVSVGVCFDGKGRQHFVEERDKININYYINDLLPNLVKDCHDLLRKWNNNFVFQKTTRRHAWSKWSNTGSANISMAKAAKHSSMHNSSEWNLRNY